MTVLTPRHQFHADLQDPAKCDFGYPEDICQMAERDHDISMMRDPDSWPRWPILPLKRRTPEDPLDCGFIVEQEEIIVYHATIFEVAEAVKDESRWLRYDSWDAVYDAAWRVD